MMVSGKNSKAVRNARAAVVTQRSIPWGTIIAAAVVVLFGAGIFGYYLTVNGERQERLAALAPFTPTAELPDPSTQIDGVVVTDFEGGVHVSPEQRVAYTASPPVGGRHDAIWATCNGVVYPEAVRSENMVHALEHGAIWIAYNPDQVTGEALATLQAKVDRQPYSVMSPYPGLDQPIALQSWGHQLKLSDAADVRIDQFIQALRVNPNTHPEPGASCQEQGPGLFTQTAPPPFEPVPTAAEVDDSTVLSETDPVPTG